MLTLTETEKLIFDTIVAYAKQTHQAVTPRVAGGWVRDKLISIPSTDLDIVLDNMSGVSFAEGLVNFMHIDKDVHKIQANPDKSKHLETAVLNLYGLDIDFVHLRNETYSDSRIPEITIGTPQEDALRRDITINALFYNLITHEIEDYTHKGLLDLHNRKISTPLDPKQTLMDDPLRILRMIRFHAKLGFMLDPTFYATLQLPEIREAFCLKVSHERVWSELYKMLNYEGGHSGLMCIIENNFTDPIFKPPTTENSENNGDTFNIVEFYACVSQFFDHLHKIKHPLSLGDQRVILSLYAVLHRYIGHKIPNTNTYSLEFMLRDSLKSPKVFVQYAVKIEENISRMHKIDIDNLNSSIKSHSSEIPLSLLREICSLILDGGFLWRDSLLIFYASGLTEDISCILSTVDEYDLEHRCINGPFKITGSDIRPLIRDMHKMKEILKETKTTEALEPHKSKEEILQSIKDQIDKQ